MWIADGWKDYELLSCGGGEKLERWDDQILVRPDPQAIWQVERSALWRKANARYSRSQTGGGHWEKNSLPQSWPIHYKELTFQVKPMNFKHTGVFPEQAANWDFIREKVASAHRPVRVLNLFAYSGGATLAAAAGGAEVWHVDAAKNMVSWAKELSISELNLLLQYALPMITTDIENSQIMSYALELFPMLPELEVKTMRIPVDGGYKSTYVQEMAVLVPSLSKNRSALKEIMSTK